MIINKKVKNIILILLVFTFYFANAQDISKDFAAVNNFFAQTNKLSVDISIDTKDNITKKIIQTQKGYFKQIKPRYINVIDNITIISDTDFVFVVDNNKKYISITKAKNKNFQNKMISPDIINEFIKYYNKIEQKIISNNIIEYTMYFSVGELKKVSITINTEKKHLLKIVAYNKEQEIAEKKIEYITTIKYSNYSNKVNDSEFSINKYLKNHNGIYTLRTEYKGYQFINMYNKKNK